MNRAGVTVGDIESGYTPYHIEFRDLKDGVPRAIEVQPDGRELVATIGTKTPLYSCKRYRSPTYRANLFAPCESTSAQHGNAFLSIIGGRPDFLGITGIAPEAQLKIAEHRLDDDTAARAARLEALVARLAPYDILLLEMQAPYRSSDQVDAYIPASLDKAFDRALRRALNKGVVIIETAGNGLRNLDTQTDRKLRELVDGTKAEFDANGQCDEIPLLDNIAVQNTLSNIATYTDFGGTSGAGAIVAGLAASLQGYHKAKYDGKGLTSPEMHALLIASARVSGRKGTGCIPNMLEAVKIIDMGPILHPAYIGALYQTIQQDRITC